MKRIYFDTFYKDELVIDDTNIYHYIVHVLRWKKGDSFIFFNGKEWMDYVYVIECIEKKYIFLKHVHTISKEFACLQYWNKVYLYHALPNRSSKIEEIIALWVQIWIHAFYFFESLHSQEKKESFLARIPRYKKIAIESAELSFRNDIPRIDWFDFNAVSLENLSGEKIVLDITNDACLLQEYVPCAFPIHVFVWPEGWWGQREREFFFSTWFQPISLGPYVLRCQVAWFLTWFYFLQTSFSISHLKK